MELLTPIIHCLIDQEPTTFHKEDAQGDTFSFAANLSLEARADSRTPHDATKEIKEEEKAAEDQYLAFLRAVQRVRFHLFRLDEALALTSVGWLDQISEGMLQNPDDLMGWLREQRDPRVARYWTTVAVIWDPETPVDVAGATATHRLRAAQSWNAPVAHRFGLTHIVSAPREVSGSYYVVLPYFDHFDIDPQPPRFQESHPPGGVTADTALDYLYDPFGGFGEVICRTNLIGEGITDVFDPSKIDKGITLDGYLSVDDDAEKVRRLLNWLEESAASLMAANPALGPPGQIDDPDFEAHFKIHVEVERKPGEPEKLKFYSKSLIWYAATRLISALDNFVIALLKPIAGPNGAPTSEGEVLAPLVSALRTRIEEELDGKLPFDPKILEPPHIAAAIRQVLKSNSPLMSATSTKSRVANALRHVHRLGPPPDELDERSLTTVLLAAYAEDADGEIGKDRERYKPYLSSILGRSTEVSSLALLELEQRLHEEAGAEAAIVRLIETVETTEDGSAPAPDQRLSALLTKAVLDPAVIQNPQADADVHAAVQRAVERAWTDYSALLDGPFNGAEAVRRATSSSFILALLTHFEKKPPTSNKRTTSQYLSTLVRVSSFYERRFFGNLPETLKELETVLLTPDVGRLPVETQSALRRHLKRAFADAVAPLRSLNDPDARFIPESTPQPLPIQIAANIDGSKVDRFARYFNGIAVAIRRRDAGDDTDRWAHAHLADLRWGGVLDDQSPNVEAAIHPMLPATSDGRGAMFIEYEGFPFADQAVDERIVDGAAETRDPRLRPFYRHDPHTTEGGFAKVPRLAYGRRFETFSFITSNAGTLPLALQKSPADPWMPAPEIVAPTGSPPRIGEVDCRRRTAIAQMAVIEQVEEGQPRRAGAAFDGVMPLATDYPRIGLQAWDGEPGVRDVFREADGTGMMVAGQVRPEETKPGNAEWRITGMDFAGAPSRLILRFFHRHAAGPTDAGNEFVIDASTVPGFTALSEIVIRIEFNEADVVEPPAPRFAPRLVVICGAEKFEQPLDAEGVVAGWLRLRLETGADPATLTFVGPAPQKSDNVAAPLLLLAPGTEDDKIWKPGLTRPVTARISTPRVGYLDFERWFSNSDLRQHMFEIGDDESPVNKAVKRFERALLAAYLMRHLDPKLALFIDRLPDPAVEAVRIELMHHDALIDGEIDRKTTQRTFPLKDRLSGFGRNFNDTVDRMLDELKLPKPSDDESDPWTPLRLRRFVFEPLDETFQFKVKLGSGASLDLADPTDDRDPAKDAHWPQIRTFPVFVPAGVVARLSVDALVSNGHFEDAGSHPSAMDSRLMQYAVRELPAGYLAFPAAAVRVETMYDAADLFVPPPTPEQQDEQKEQYNRLAIELAERMISAEGIERTRRFDVMTAAALLPRDSEAQRDRERLTRRWRILGEVDVTTQRWRPSGRPIYHYVNPRVFRKDAKGADAELRHPALPLLLDPDRKLAQFEVEAFFDRSDVDAQTVPQRLDPLPARTKLQEHHWNSESATYFRHRFTLRSRYAGALRQPEKREVVAWPTRKLETPAQPGPAQNLDTPAHAWTMRIAMLADLSRMLLTRPQLRALIPLTTAPGGEGVLRRRGAQVERAGDGDAEHVAVLSDALEVEPTAPPIAAVLQEPPFARAGLADRIAAEIKTGFGYGFENDEKHVEIRDSRKEGGPNPYLDYRPLDGEVALGLVLRSEGPLGLTFDSVNAPAPAFPNAMVLLRPDNLLAKPQPLEEFFAGVAMQRYVDPAWTTSPSSEARALDGERCWWIDIDPQRVEVGTQSLLYFNSRGDGGEADEVEGEEEEKRRQLLCFTTGAEHIDLYASKRAIDGVGGTVTDWVAIARFAVRHFESLSILHQPVAPGRYATAIFVRTKSKTERGEINAPTMLASFEWSPFETAKGDSKDGERRPTFVQLETGVAATAYATMASAPTFWRWTKTSRDFDLIHIPELIEGTWKSGATHVRELVAELDHETHEFLTFKRRGAEAPVWLRSSTFTNPYPLHLHRHLGLITSRFLKELGTPAEVFCRTSADADRKHRLVTIEGELRTNGRIYKPQEQIVRVVEFETRAAILSTAPAVPDTYKQAYFDLVSTVFNLGKTEGGEDETPGCLRLYFRFIGSPAHVQNFSGITLKLWAPPQKRDQAFELPVKWKNTDTFVVGVQLVLRRSDSEETTYNLQLLRSDGALESPAPEKTKGDLFKLQGAGKLRPGFLVSIAAPKGSGEFWTDVSLLHSPQALATNPLDLLWLFSSSGEGDPASQVALQGLTTMVEAQARIVAVSPPIPIIKH